MPCTASSDMSSSESNSLHGARWAAENRSVSENIERSVNPPPELTCSQFDGTWRAGNGGLVTIHGHMCSLFSKFQVDVASRTCTGTVDGNTFSGMLQGDGHGISWSDGDTWTLMDGVRSADLPQQQPARSNSRETHTPTQTADSEESGKRESKETDTDRHRHRTKRPPNTRTRHAGARTTRYDQTANTRKKTESRFGHTNSQHTVTLTEAPTWHPTPRTHVDKAPANRHNRRHPAGAHPISWRGSRSSITALPARRRIVMKWGDAPMSEKAEPEEVPASSKTHFVEERQTITRRSDTTVRTTVLRAPLTIVHSPLISTANGLQAIKLSSPSPMTPVTFLGPSRATRTGDVALAVWRTQRSSENSATMRESSYGITAIRG